MEKFIRYSLAAIGFACCMTFVSAITQAKIVKLKNDNALYSADVVSIKTREKQLDCLAMNIYREAGSEPFEGKVAVAQVTMNRVNHPQFPKDICGVIYQKNVIMDKVVCQFSWFCDSAVKTRPVNKVAYNESYEVAKKVLLENFRLDILKDALYYHAEYVNPRWGLPKIGKIGAHVFYKGKDTNERI